MSVIRNIHLRLFPFVFHLKQTTKLAIEERRSFHRNWNLPPSIFPPPEESLRITRKESLPRSSQPHPPTQIKEPTHSSNFNRFKELIPGISLMAPIGNHLQGISKNPKHPTCSKNKTVVFQNCNFSPPPSLLFPFPPEGSCRAGRFR